MKKNSILKLFAAAVVSAPILTGCIEETFPESGSATSEQIGASATALEASVNGIPSQMVQAYLVGKGTRLNETDLAYPGLMLVQSNLLGDIVPADYGYNWWWSYNGDYNMGNNTYYSYLPWFTCYQFIKSANDVIASVDINAEGISSEMKGYAGIAYATRAFAYYHLMLLYEPMDNIYTDCSNVLGLTAPIVRETTTNDEAKNNPRATHDEMVSFILSDLDIAENAFANFTPSEKTFPGLAAVYGMKARVYMWDEDYANAADYARRAIDTCGGQPMTASEWLNPTTAFNTATSGWIWYLHPTPDNMGNLANFIGHIASENSWGYAELYMPMINRSLYDEIAYTDFRKQAWLDPDRSAFDYQLLRTDADWHNNAPDYLSLKFRCNAGNTGQYTIGAEVDIPVMRVEEMYLIEAEAIGASQGVAAGVAKLNSFMQGYRQPDYNFNTSDLRTFQLEVLKQMRIEFWGEGVAFPAAKRLKPDIIQNYDGTNYVDDHLKINTRGGKPNWTLVIPYQEVDANVALQGMNNPDPTSAIPVRPTPIGEFAAGNN